MTNAPELAERLIRIKDSLTNRADRDALSDAVNRGYADAARIIALEAKLASLGPIADILPDALTAENAALKERVAKLNAALNQSRLAFAGYVSAQSAVDLIDALQENRNDL